jgi:protein-L-isoaspartate O-methyltransferase
VELLRKDSYQAIRIRHDAMAMLQALADLLQEHGLVVVPHEPNDAMEAAALRLPASFDVRFYEACRAYPNPLRKPT